MARARRLGGAAAALILALGALTLLSSASAQVIGESFLMGAGLKGDVTGATVEDFTPEDAECITEPKVYAAAFKERKSTCTENLAVRLGSVGVGQVPDSWYAAVANKTAGAKVPTPWVEAEKRLREGMFTKFANFLGVGDQPRKYLAIGNPSAPRGSITTISNGQAFLEEIGYALAESDISQVGLLAVFRDPTSLSLKGKYKKGYFGDLKANGTTIKIKKGKLPKNNKKWDGTRQSWPKAFVPMWESVLKYMDKYTQKYINAALPGVPDVVQVLKTKTFQELSGCPASCVFEDLGFPDPTGSTHFPPANTPVRFGSYTPSGECVLTDGSAYPSGTLTNATVPDPFQMNEPKALVPRFRILAGDAVDPRSPNCTDASFKEYRDWYANPTIRRCPNFTDFSGNIDANGFLTQFAKFWNDGSATPHKRALLVKVALSQGCMGSFNYLFSGNGLTYTGSGGVFTPLGSEKIMEQMTPGAAYGPVINAGPDAAPKGLLPACNGVNAATTPCWNGLPFIAKSCMDDNLNSTTNEGLFCDAKSGLGATFMPICFNGNTPNLDSSTYPNDDPTYACNPAGRKCVNGALCCSSHCDGMRGGDFAYDPNCATNSTLPGCTYGNCRKCRLVGGADVTLPLCPRCYCTIDKWWLGAASCDTTGF
ncbi:MAG: hypothetical protein J3K34DRAFT_404701 [Monoraphidium minutum]|nr:MAG: hypothetical protein J3K34DRAFT_404701 [Monoraphidium minutum]